MFGKVMLFVWRELAGPIKDLVLAIRRGDETGRKRALIRIQNEAERLAMKKARGL